MPRTRILLLSLLLLLGGCSDSGSSGDASDNERIDAAAEMTSRKILVDDAALLGDKPKLLRDYYKFNEMLRKDYDIDFRVITTLSEEDIDRFANRKFNELQKESRSKSGKALLLVINPIRDKVRLEVSQALEPIYTDAFVSYVERKGMVPYFRDDKVADGIYMMAELISDRAIEARKGKEFLPPMPSRSIGAGAKSQAKIGRKDPEAKAGPKIEAHGKSPIEVLQQHLELMRNHNRNPDQPIYSRATRKFLRKWTVTEVNMDNEVRFLTPCMGGTSTKISPDGRHAVLLNEPLDRHRTCSPYFLVKEDGQWRLDLADMSRILRFNQEMLWHFDKKERLQGEGIHFAFAFDGYQLDRHGYPHSVDPEKAKPADARWGYTCKAWYRPGEDPAKLTRCWIARVWPGSPAEIRMGMEVYDYVYAVGEGDSRIENVSYRQFMEYMKSIPSGEIATVEMERYRKGEKSPSRVIRKGIAP